MINWNLFSPRNLFVIVLFSMVAYVIFNHFWTGE